MIRNILNTKSKAGALKPGGDGGDIASTWEGAGTLLRGGLLSSNQDLKNAIISGNNY
jgi:hypothetical protein